MDGTLYFEKISRFDRRAEPVTVSIPFAKGALRDPDRLAIADPASGAAYAHQSRALATWDDGSVKWLLVHLQPDLPGNAERTLTFTVDGAAAPAPAARVTVEEVAEGVRVDTGVLSFLVGREGFLPLQDVALEGKALFGARPFSGFQMTIGGQAVSTAGGPVELEVEEAGPLRAVILVRGVHRRADGAESFQLRGRITAYAGKPYVEVEHGFVHTLEENELALTSLTLAFRPEQGGSSPELALGEGYYQTGIQRSSERVEKLLDAETMLYQSNEHFIDCFYGDFWADWRDASGGLTLSVYQAHQNFPKALEATPEGIVAYLYPESVDPAPVLRGMGKTHRLMLHFHGPQAPLEELSARSLQFQLPDVPALPREWYRDNNPWVEQFFPDRLPGKMVTRFLTMHDNRPHALGMMHFGDAPNASYTNQGRGRGETVWVNNEYDHAHACALLYGLTGQRRALDSGVAAAKHWIDVDLCKYDPDPLIQGGLKIHTRYHGTGGVTPSHEWTEGLLDYYFLTGRREGLEAAVMVGENIMRHMARPRMRTPGEAAVREGGWALRAMVGLYLATGEKRWEDEARRLAEMFVDWYERYGALLAPYTSHSMPRVTFMISLTVNSFGRYLLIADDERVKRLIAATVDDMLAHCLGPDGVPYYKELPSLRHPHETPHIVESLTLAYRITGDTEYLKLATRFFAFIDDSRPETTTGAKIADSSGAVIDPQGWFWSCLFAEGYTSILLYAGAAAAHDMLKWYEYPA